MKESFRSHLRDAVAINSRRQDYYAEQSEGRSRKLSRYLILSERLSVPVALYFDRKARPFQEQGIGVVRDDFVSMDTINEMKAPPRFSGRVGERELEEIKGLLGGYREDVQGCLEEGDFGGVCELTQELLHELEERERTLNAHFAMIKHLMESTGFAAVNAMKWARESDGATVDLSKKLVDVQVRTLPYSLLFDKWAQPCHQCGCGILVNDVPPIPFLERYQERFQE